GLSAHIQALPTSARMPSLPLLRIDFSTVASPSPTPPDDIGGLLHHSLTPIEAELIGHLMAGLSNQQIADALGKTLGTVKNQLSAIYAKLNLHSRSQLIALLRKNVPVR